MQFRNCILPKETYLQCKISIIREVMKIHKSLIIIPQWSSVPTLTQLNVTSASITYLKLSYRNKISVGGCNFLSLGQKVWIEHQLLLHLRKIQLLINPLIERIYHQFYFKHIYQHHSFLQNSNHLIPMIKFICQVSCNLEGQLKEQIKRDLIFI